jgi:hypothetical protein
MIRGAQAAEGGLQGAGACSGPRGSPGQHARLWVSRCRLLKRRSSIVGGRSIFSNFQHPPGELDDRRCAGSGGRTPGCRRLLGASGQPGAACAPLGKQMPALEAPVQHRRGQVDFLEFPTPHRRARCSEVRRQRSEDSRVQAPARGLGAARGSMRASG